VIENLGKFYHERNVEYLKIRKMMDTFNRSMIRFSDQPPQEYDVLDEIVEVIQTRTLRIIRSKLCLSFEAIVENAYDPNC
jgi:hypothetical protein